MEEKTEAKTTREAVTQSWLDVAPRYLEFLVRSIGRSSNAYLRGLTSRGQVSPQLTALLLGGLALSQVLVWAFPSAALEADTGNAVTLVRRIDFDALPAVLTFVVTLFAAPLHAGLQLVAASEREAEDTINGAIAWLAVLLPATTALVLLIAHGLPESIFLPLAVGLGLYAPVHLWRCLRAMTPPDAAHRESPAA